LAFDILIGEYARATVSTANAGQELNLSVVTLSQDLDTLRGVDQDLYEVPRGTAESFISLSVDSVRAFSLTDPSVLSALNGTGASADLVAELSSNNRNGGRVAGIDLVLPSDATAAGGDDDKTDDEVDGAQVQCEAAGTSDGEQEDVDEASSEEGHQEIEDGDIDGKSCTPKEGDDEGLEEDEPEGRASEEALSALDRLNKPAFGALAASAFGWSFLKQPSVSTRRLDRTQFDHLAKRARSQRFKSWDRMG